jgi:hypothetical protein
MELPQDEPRAVATLPDAIERPLLPPLRISHLMVWMSATALLISVVIWFDRIGVASLLALCGIGVLLV